MRSRVRNIRLIVLSASTLEELVNSACATMKVNTANGPVRAPGLQYTPISEEIL